jgi:hypothetical protein
MKSFNRAFNINDDLYTPPCLVECLDIFINQNINTVLCPFDNEKSEYVKYFRNHYVNVLFGDLSTNDDFFNRTKPDVDIIISNPPFSQKLAVFEKLFEWGIPFAMLMNLMSINYQEIGNLFCNQKIPPQFIIPDKKVSFNGKTSSFCSGYVTWKFITSTKYVHLNNNNTGVNFVPAEGFLVSKNA